MVERPSSAVYPYAAALLLGGSEVSREEALLLKAASLDHQIVEPYVALVRLYSGYDNGLALNYAKKALQIKPAVISSQLAYASALWQVDPKAARRYYEDLFKRLAGTEDGARAFREFINEVDDPAETGSLVERFRRDCPAQWTPGYVRNFDLFSWLFRQSADKGLAFAKEILASFDQSTPRDDVLTIRDMKVRTPGSKK
jgi:hypothetical protein